MYYNDLTMEYRATRWLVRFNTSILPPQLKRDGKKVLIVNGYKMGYAEFRYGVPPVSSLAASRPPIHRFKKFVKHILGYGTIYTNKGYVFAVISKHPVVMTFNFTGDAYMDCHVYHVKSATEIGYITFTPGFCECKIISYFEGTKKAVAILAGFIVDAFIPRTAVVALNRTVRIVN